jgi:hypothetical protein
MMDPLTAVSLLASVVQLIDATTKAVNYLNDVKNAPRDRARQEAVSLLALLTRLRYDMDEADEVCPRYQGVRLLGAKKGPFEQIMQAMQDLANKLEPKTELQEALAIEQDSSHLDDENILSH